MSARYGRRAVAVGLLAGGLAACAGATSDLPVMVGSERIPATVVKPDGPGPFPAVVILHDCSGLGPRSSGAPGRWARELQAHGYVSIVPDSFTTRGHPDGVCTNPSPSRAEVSPVRRVADAYATLAWARSLPYVDGQRVGLMGGSHGGTTTLAAMAAAKTGGQPTGRDSRAGFRAAVALYPGCAAKLGSWRPDGTAAYRPVAPVLILIGEKDDWTPPAPCRRLAESTRAERYPVTLMVYPDAHHSFDSDRPVRYVASRVNMNAPGGRGATTGGDPKAWADSISRVVEFFGRNL